MACGTGSALHTRYVTVDQFTQPSPLHAYLLGQVSRILVATPNVMPMLIILNHNTTMNECIVLKENDLIKQSEGSLFFRMLPADWYDRIGGNMMLRSGNTQKLFLEQVLVFFSFSPVSLLSNTQAYDVANLSVHAKSVSSTIDLE